MNVDWFQPAAMQRSCLDMALEGERLCKAGDCRTGVQFFEAAVQIGTTELKTLSAIYSQLGNAYFHLQDLGKSLEYHRHDLNLARCDFYWQYGKFSSVILVSGFFDDNLLFYLQDTTLIGNFLI